MDTPYKVSSILRASFSLITVALLCACTTLSFDEHKATAHRLTDTENTKFGHYLTQWNAEHEGLSGFFPLTDGMDALGARLW